MSPKTRRTRIEIETHDLRVIRFGTGRESIVCDKCGEKISAQTIAKLADALGVTVTDVDPLLEAKRIHSLELPPDRSLICDHSPATDERKP